MEQKVRSCLMFSHKAEQAVKFYTSVFRESEIKDIIYFDDNVSLGERKVMHGIFVLKGQEIMFMDSTVDHDFTFTPSLSLFVNCENEEEIDRIFQELSNHGKILIPLESYDYSRKYGWVEDEYGVTWQLNLE